MFERPSYIFFAMLAPLAAAAPTASTGVLPSNSSVASLPPDTTYLLPSSFLGNDSTNFLQTQANTSRLPSSLQQTPFIAYDPSFLALLPTDAALQLIASSDSPVADEMGIWVWDHNQVWMASASVNNVSYVTVLDLSTHKLHKPNTSIPILNPNGGYYHNGTVYIAGDGDSSTPPSIYAVDPVTLHASVVVDSYFGLRFGGPNDITWASHGDKSCMFFTDDPLSSLYSGGNMPQLPDAVWRFDPYEKTLLPVIDRTDLLVPNGIRVNKNSTKLFVTDTPPLEYGAGAGISASSGIYVFDLDKEGYPSNRRLFGIAERGIADGLHLDDSGRVWTGEADGIVVRSPDGKVIGMFNALAILGEDADGQRPLQNFALAGDMLVILAYEKIYAVKLSHSIVTGLT